MAISVRTTRTWRSCGWATVARRVALLLAALAVTACATAPAPPASTPLLSPATSIEAAGMVDVRALVPDLSQDIRYFGSDNFVGAPVDGYLAPRCWLKREAAQALARVEASLRLRNQRLRVYDCYRPARAVAHFMRWVEDPNDVATKARFYPELDMGTEFDFFGPRANTDSPLATDAQRRNRHALRDAMAAEGFHNYAMEWWHYTFRPEPSPGILYDVPITEP